MFKTTLIIASALILSACGTPRTVLQTQIAQLKISEALLIACRRPEGLVSERGTEEAIHNSDQWRTAFDVCSGEHDALIDAVQAAQDGGEVNGSTDND